MNCPYHGECQNEGTIELRHELAGVIPIKVCDVHLANYTQTNSGWSRVVGQEPWPTAPDKLIFVEMQGFYPKRKVFLAPWYVGMGDTVVAYTSEAEQMVGIGKVTGIAKPLVLPTDKPPRRIIGKVALA